MALTKLNGDFEYVLVTNNQAAARYSTITDTFRLNFALAKRAPRLLTIMTMETFEAVKNRGSEDPAVKDYALSFNNSISFTWINRRISGCCPICILTFSNPSFHALVMVDNVSIPSKIRIGQLAFIKCPLEGQDYHFSRRESEVLFQFTDILWGQDSYGHRTADLKNLIARYKIRFVLPDKFPTE